MQVDIKTKKIEAVKRMKALGILPATIKEFENADRVNISEPPFGALYWADGEDLERIRRFEKQNNAVVFMVVRSYTSLGQMDSLLFVSDYPEEWDYDREDIKENRVLAYVFNLDMPQHVKMESTGRRSTALCEQICAVSVTRLGEYCGHGSEAEMQAIDKALCASLGLTPPKARSELAELTATRAQLDMMTKLYKDLLAEKIFD